MRTLTGFVLGTYLALIPNISQGDTEKDPNNWARPSTIQQEKLGIKKKNEPPKEFVKCMSQNNLEKRTQSKIQEGLDYLRKKISEDTYVLEARDHKAQDCFYITYREPVTGDSSIISVRYVNYERDLEAIFNHKIRKINVVKHEGEDSREFMNLVRGALPILISARGEIEKEGVLR